MWVHTMVCASVGHYVSGCVCDTQRQTDNYRDKDKQIRHGAGAFFLSWVRERGLCRALFPVVHSCGDLVTPVSSQPMS